MSRAESTNERPPATIQAASEKAAVSSTKAMAAAQI
jgi:hypothetical protein